MDVDHSLEARLKDVILLLFAVLLAIVAEMIPFLFPLFIVAVLIALAVFVEELVRRLDEYAS